MIKTLLEYVALIPVVAAVVSAYLPIPAVLRLPHDLERAGSYIAAVACAITFAAVRGQRRRLIDPRADRLGWGLLVLWPISIAAFYAFASSVRSAGLWPDLTLYALWCAPFLLATAGLTLLLRP